MKKKIPILAILLIAIAVTTWMLMIPIGANENDELEFGEIRVGSLETTVTVTGTLAARETVEVGTQVSGMISQVFVDFNDSVDDGQILAIIDPDLLDATVKDSRACLAKAEAQLAQAEALLQVQQTKIVDATANHNRAEPLFKDGYISAAEYQPIQTALAAATAQLDAQKASVATAKAVIMGAEATVERAIKNRENAEIANVDESDVGKIAEGQPVRFIAASHPELTFDGITKEVRLLPETISNVVNYSVAIEASNDSGILLPGMTTTVDFVTSRVEDALLIPTLALDVQMGSRESRNVDRAEDTKAPALTGTERSRSNSSARRESAITPGVVSARDRSNAARVWYLDNDGAIQNVLVQTGASDGFTTQITPLRGEITAGMTGGDVGEVKLIVADILNQESAVTRTVSETFIEDSQTQTLGRYVMLSSLIA